MKKIRTFLSENEILGLVIFSLFTFFLRSLYVFYQYQKYGVVYGVDSLVYLHNAEDIIEKTWLISHMVVGPAIPLLVILFIKMFNDPNTPFYVYNIIATSLLIPVLFILGKELFSKNVGWALVIWGILFIDFFKFLPFIAKESSIFLFLPLSLLFLIRSIKYPDKYWNIIFSSLSFAWLIHTDERFFAYFPIFILSFLLIRPFLLKKSIKSATMWTFIVLLLMLPWGIRNYLAFNQVVILSSRTTVFTSKIWGEDISKMPFTNSAYDKYYMSSESEANEFAKKYGVTPREYGKFESRARAFVNFWQPTYFKATFIQYGFRPQKWSLSHNIAGLLFYGLFIPFYLIGIILLIKQKYFLGLFIASIPFIHSILHAYMIWPLERYRSPVTFIVVMIGFWTIQQIYINLKYRKSIDNTKISSN